MNFDKYTDRSRNFVQSAQALAQREDHQHFAAEHLLKVMLDDREGLAAGLIDRAGGNSRQALAAAEAALAKRPKVSGSGAGQIYLDPALARVFGTAEKAAEKSGDSFVTVERLLLALALEKSSEAAKVLADAGVTPQILNAAIEALRKGRTADSTGAEASYEALRKYTQDLTRAARDGKLDPVFGRDDEIRRTIQVLSRRGKNSPVLVGEPGVGKTAIVNALALRIVTGDVPEILQDKRLLALNMGALIAGSKYRGEFEERFKAVLDELKAAAGSCILLVEGLHVLISGGRSQSANEAADLLKPALDQGELQCVATTTPEGFRKYIEGDEAFARRVQPISVAELSVEETISALRGIKARYEQHHRVRITDKALIAAATLAQRYGYESRRFLPDKAIDLVDEAAARLKMQIDSKPYEIDTIDREIIQLKIEQEALSKEADADSKERLGKLAREIASLEKTSGELTVRWRQYIQSHVEAAKLRREIDSLRDELATAQRQAHYDRAAELTYRVIPDVEKRLKDLGAADRFGLVEEAVTANHIAYVISQETGVPVKQILEGQEDFDDVRRSGKVFICYRRDDTAGHAGRVHDRLEGEFGRDLLFMDVDSVPLGSDFAKVLREAVSQCQVLLAVMGPRWLDAHDEGGRPKLDDSDDFVRIEIKAALDRDIQVIPILLDGAKVPKADRLPADIRGLALRQGLEIRHVSFHSDMDKLIQTLKNQLKPARARQ